MMKNSLKVALLVSAMPFAVMASDMASDSGMSPWYVGVGVGVNNYEPNCDLKTMQTCGDDDPYAWDGFVGYLFNDFFGIEAGYRNLGRAEWTDYFNKLNDVGVKGATLGLVANFPFSGNWSLSGEAGAMNYLIYNNKQWGTEYYSDSGTAPYVGAGLGYNINDNMKLSVKYRRYENLDEEKWNTLQMESNYWGLELSYRFGSKSMPIMVAALPEPVDSDGDGVYDDRDRCPGTPPTHRVDAYGCTLYQDDVSTQRLEVHFANDSAVIHTSSYGEIERFADYLKQHKDQGNRVEIGGHASNVGAPAYNMRLSERRARAVAKMLVEKYGVSPGRVTSRGYGITRPVMQGNTPEAHAANRRVEAVITGSEKVPVLK